MILSKRFLPERRMWRVKRNEDKKAGKKREKDQEEIWNGFSKKKKKIWLIGVHQSDILRIVTRNLYQNVAAMRKSALIANLGQK